MAKDVLNIWGGSTLEDVMAALEQAAIKAKSRGYDPSTVKVNKPVVGLVEETAPDGTKVLKVHLFEGMPRVADIAGVKL